MKAADAAEEEEEKGGGRPRRTSVVRSPRDAAAAAVARLYVAAHLPLDVVGGAGLGVLVGSVVKLASGRPATCS